VIFNYLIAKFTQTNHAQTRWQQAKNRTLKMKTLKIITLILHSLILIGAGHGIGFLIFVDLAGIPALFMNKIEFKLNNNYEDNLMLVGIISVIGKVMLIVSLLLKEKRNKYLTASIGISLLWVSVYFLTSGNWNYTSLYEFSFWSSIPFLISSIILTIVILIKIYEKKEMNIELNEK